jgi:pimeloyl-ACP methyl ester carboxylesterase
MEEAQFNIADILGKPESFGGKECAVEKRELSVMSGRNKLYGFVLVPGDSPLEVQGKLPTVVLSHGYGGDTNSNFIVGQSLAMSGICCYLYDFAGGGQHSQSEGKTTEMSVFTEMDDLNAVIDKITTLDFVDKKRFSLFGQSQGGFVSAVVAAQRPRDIASLFLQFPALCIHDDARRVWTLAPIPDAANFMGKKLLPDEMDFMGLRIGRAYYEKILDYDVYEHIGNYEGDVLIFHGDADSLVPLIYSEKAAAVYKHAKLIVFPGQEHGFAAPGQNQKVARLVYEHIRLVHLR